MRCVWHPLMHRPRRKPSGRYASGVVRGDSAPITVPNGQYVIKVEVLKALGDETNPAHWETWTTPVITIARPVPGV